MKKVITYTLCDRVNIHLDGDEPGYEVTLLDSNAKPRIVDMCEPCEKGITLVEARELADAIGQPLPPAKRRKRKGTPAMEVCKEPGCGAEFDTAQGLGLHKNRAHGIKSENHR